MTIPGNLISSLFAKTATAAPTATFSTYATLNPADKGSLTTLSADNLTLTIPTLANAYRWNSARATQGKSTGKWVYEATFSSQIVTGIGFADASASVENYFGAAASGGKGTMFCPSDRYYTNGVNASATLPTIAEGTPVMIAIDADAGSAWLIVNGRPITGIGSNEGNPAAGTYPTWTWTPGTTIFPGVSLGEWYSVGTPAPHSVTVNFGQTPFTNPVPAGFNAGWGTAIVTPVATTATDTYWSGTSLLLSADGVNGKNNNVFVDSSSSNLTVTRNGNTTQGSVNPFMSSSWSGKFNGVGSRISIDPNAAFAFGTGDFTAEVFVNVSAASGGAGLNGGILFGDILWQFGYQGGWYLSITSTGAIEFTRGGSISAWDTVSSSTGVVALNNWYHIAAVRKTGTTTIYLNGTSLFTFGNTQNYTIGRTFLINAGLGDGVYYGTFNGLMSNLRLVKGTAVYTSNFAVPTQNLTAIAGTSLLALQDSTFKDNSSNNLTLVSTGSTATTQLISPFTSTVVYNAALHGGSMYFDGVSDYLAIADSPSLNFGSGEFTIEFWFNTATGSVEYQEIVTKGAGIQLYLKYNKIAVALSSSNTVNYFINTELSTAIEANKWYHIALVKRNSNTYLVYLNGVLDKSTVTTAIPDTGSSPVVVGGYLNGEYPFNGFVSNLRIVKGTAVYTANFTPPTAPVTAIAGTALLLNGTNAGIYDSAARIDVETVGDTKLSTTVKKYGSASIAFDGNGDYLTIPANSQNAFGTGDFTIEFWVNPDTRLINYPALFSNTVYSADSFLCYERHGSFPTKFSVWIGPTAAPQLVSQTSIVPGTWYHLAIARSGSTVRLFINGAIESTLSNYSGSMDGGIPLTRIGSDFSNNQFNGYIDDFRITVGTARYTADFTPPTALLS